MSLTKVELINQLNDAACELTFIPDTDCSVINVGDGAVVMDVNYNPKPVDTLTKTQIQTALKAING